jgi:fumarylacetoacetase
LAAPGFIGDWSRVRLCPCLLELTLGRRQPLVLAGGERRAYLEDGDTVTLRACCQRDGWTRIGFGGRKGTVSPSQLLQRRC